MKLACCKCKVRMPTIDPHVPKHGQNQTEPKTYNNLLSIWFERNRYIKLRSSSGYIWMCCNRNRNTKQSWWWRISKKRERDQNYMDEFSNLVWREEKHTPVKKFNIYYSRLFTSSFHKLSKVMSRFVSINLFNLINYHLAYSK